MKKIYFIVNNELNYDQRMIRICTAMNFSGYEAHLVGKKYPASAALVAKAYKQERISCWFKTGKLAYIEFNLKLFFFLLFKRPDCLCAIDLDTIFPVFLVSMLKRCHRVYDAHELFTEMKEVVSRPVIRKIWNWVERTTVPHFPLGYTVSESITQIFEEKYGVNYRVIRNVPVKAPVINQVPTQERYLLYQGAVNHGRCLENLIPAMKDVNARLVICGDGNFMEQSRKLTASLHLQNKIFYKGMLLPADLVCYTSSAYIGVNLVEPKGLNQLYSLANKFFDYIHAGVPQLTMDFVEYSRINKLFKVALLIPDADPATISGALNLLLENDVLYKELKENCIRAREIYNWQNEQKLLIGFYDKIFK